MKATKLTLEPIQDKSFNDYCCKCRKAELKVLKAEQALELLREKLTFRLLVAEGKFIHMRLELRKAGIY